MNINHNRFLSVLLISILLISNGCSMYGLGIGAIIDARNSDTKILNREDYKSIYVYREITIYQKDRTTKTGKFIEISGDEFILETNFGLESVNMTNIANIEVKSEKNAIWKGLGVGIALDIAYFVLLVNNIQENGN